MRENPFLQYWLCVWSFLTSFFLLFSSYISSWVCLLICFAASFCLYVSICNLINYSFSSLAENKLFSVFFPPFRGCFFSNLIHPRICWNYIRFLFLFCAFLLQWRNDKSCRTCRWLFSFWWCHTVGQWRNVLLPADDSRNNSCGEF